VQPTDAIILISLSVLAGVLEFLAAAFITGFVARRLRIEDATFPTFLQALWATFLRDVAIALSFQVLYSYLGVPLGVSLLVAAGALPVVVHKLVFETSLTRAGLLWLMVAPAEAVVAGALGGGAALLARSWQVHPPPLF